METATTELIHNSLEKSYSYAEYRKLVADLAEKGGATGPVQTEALVQYTQLNDRRMRRWDKTLKFNEEITEKIKGITQKIKWVVLSESWCGDASPALPVMNKITELNPNISLSIILRDENIAVMNKFLTNDAMSIPKLVIIDEEKEDVVATWGPRSIKATELVREYKEEHGKLTPEFKQDLQMFYNKDKGQSIVDDLLMLLALK